MDDKSIIPLSDDKSIVVQNQYLNNAKDLVVAGEREEACQVVVSVLRMNQNNTEAIWMYANLVPDNDKAAKALRRLLRLEPEHDKARQMLQRVESIEADFIEETQPVKVTKPSEAFPVSHTNAENDRLMKQLLLQQQQLLQMQMRQQNTSPVINITNTPTATANAMNYAGPRTVLVEVEERDPIAFMIGLLAGIFFATFGVAHLMTGKIGRGILYILGGWLIWAPVALGLMATPRSSAVWLVLPIHCIIAYVCAKSGAMHKTIQHQRTY